MRMVLLVMVVSASAALALPGEQVSQITLLAAEDSGKSLSLPPPPVQPLPLSGVSGGEPLSRELKLRLISMEMHLLDVSRDDIAGPLFLTLLGGTGVFGGLTALAIAAAGAGYTPMIIGLIMLMVSGGPFLIGLPWLLVALGHNAKIDRQLQKLEFEYSALGGVTLREAPQPATLVARF